MKSSDSFKADCYVFITAAVCAFRSFAVTDQLVHPEKLLAHPAVSTAEVTPAEPAAVQTAIDTFPSTAVCYIT